jgi:hypothetical protein
MKTALVASLDIDFIFRFQNIESGSVALNVGLKSSQYSGKNGQGYASV